MRASQLVALEPAAAIDIAVSPADDPDPRNETSIAVSLLDERIIVGASKVIVGGGGVSGRGDTRVTYYFSSDGGNTWGSGFVGLETREKTWGRVTDPSVASDLEGNFYLCVLMLDNSSFDSGVYVFKSTDSGRTFGDPTPAVANIGQGTSPKLADKCYITVDTSPTSPFKNTVYAVWISIEPDRTVILSSHRRPGDAGFSEPKAISHSGDMRGPSITTGPNGEFYAAWEGIGNPRVLLFNASTDGGETFLPGTVAPSTDINIHSFSGNLSPPAASLNLFGVPRMNSHPVIDVDRSTGPNRGMIYVAWAETTNRRDADVFAKRITPPNGAFPNISSRVLVNNDGGGGDQFFPWLSVDSSTGAVEVAFYDRRETGGTLMNLFLARSENGGISFAENTRISAVVSDPNIQSRVLASNGNIIGIGDYLGMVAARGKAHMLWTDTRRGKQDIFYGQLNFGSSPPPPIGSLGDECGNARAITSLPYGETVDTSVATSATNDPFSCSGSQDTNTVWYMLTPAVDTIYGVDTFGSDYDTVVSIFTGACGSLTLAACSDDFGSAISPANRSILTFAARAGVTYLIEVSGKGSAGSLHFRVGYPTITGVEYTSAPDESDALKITGAGFVSEDVTVIVQKEGDDTPLPRLFFTDVRQGDGTTASFYATKKKLKKLIKRGNTVVVQIESPAGSGRLSVPFSFTR
jgi:hypothetical protein